MWCLQSVLLLSVDRHSDLDSRSLFGEAFCHSLMRNYFCFCQQDEGITRFKSLSSDCVKPELSDLHFQTLNMVKVFSLINVTATTEQFSQSAPHTYWFTEMWCEKIPRLNAMQMLQCFIHKLRVTASVRLQPVRPYLCHSAVKRKRISQTDKETLSGHICCQGRQIKASRVFKSLFFNINQKKKTICPLPPPKSTQNSSLSPYERRSANALKGVHQQTHSLVTVYVLLVNNIKKIQQLKINQRYSSHQ